MVAKNKKRLEPDYGRFRSAVLKRDKHKCQMPHCENKHNLVIHHVRTYAERYSLRTHPDNGITLCRKCHRSTFGKEKKYAALFLSIIKENNE